MLKQAVALALLSLFCLQAQAKVDAAQAARIGSELTPLGGERAANADGSIPAWNGGISSVPSSYQPGMHHPDPYAGEQPLYRINKDNAGQYSALLTPGLKALLDKYPEYYLQVFPSHRSASAPQYIYDATRKNAEHAELIAGGNGVSGTAEGIPFPIPQNGLEAIWNHIMRFRGEQLHMQANHVAVLANGDYSLVMRDRYVYFIYNRQGMQEKDLNNTLFYYKYNVTAPAKLAGSALLVQETIDQVLAIRKAWRFNRGERRVRRLPMLAYDALQPDTNGMVLSDQTDIYNGAPDRYEWKLLGKKEMLMPYNSYAVHQKGIPYEKILQSKHLNPDLLRYEKHRVWVVEGDLRLGFSHPYAKRRFYIDEDSWQILAVDLYDKSGELVGVQEGHPINYYEVPVFYTTLETIYDLKGGRYFADGLDNNEPMIDFKVELSPRDFTPQKLRQQN